MFLLGGIGLLKLPEILCVGVLMGSPEVSNRFFAVCLTFNLQCCDLWTTAPELFVSLLRWHVVCLFPSLLLTIDTSRLLKLPKAPLVSS